MKREWWKLLASVSRSFYLSMRFLPSRMREGVACAYLLARGTDTIADAAEASVDARLATLDWIRDAINDARPGGDCSMPKLLRKEFVRTIGHEGEQNLLLRYGDCLDMFRELEAGQRDSVRRVLNTIIDGQRWDLEYFSCNYRVEDAGQLDLYTYRVAGCVGEFWTDIGFQTYGDAFAVRGRDDMYGLGRLYGQGLQLVNILRDRREDSLNGRSYLPDDDDWREWLARARNNLEQGIDYACALTLKKARFTTLLPALLGLKTLDLIEGNPGVRQKVSRREVRKAMWEAFLLALKKAR